MGLDVHVGVDNHEQVFTPQYENDTAQRMHKHNLSRTFCWLMCRREAIEEEPELDQIGRITVVDIAPLYAMEQYTTELTASESAEYAETEVERDQIFEQARASRDRLAGNLDLVLRTIEALLESLAHIDDLPSRLQPHRNDRLNPSVYFGDFELDQGDGYIGNNFGQDLRNLRRFLLYAKSRGTKTVYFGYG
jgi:hypothetical protein